MMIANRVKPANKTKVAESLKRMLLSRNTEEQLKAVIFINQTLEKLKNTSQEYETVLEYLIVNDMCVFLCEASATLQVQLLRNILKCLQRFSKSSIFYKKSYAPQVVTSIIRTIQFLVKENGSENIIDSALRFLSEIFFDVNKYQMPSILSGESIYNILQLFEMLTTIFEKINFETETKLSSSLVLHSVIYKKKEKEENEITVKAFLFATNSIKKCLEGLYQLLVDSKYKYSRENKLDCVFGMLCNISIDSMHFCGSTKSIKTRYENESNTEDSKIVAFKTMLHDTVFQTMKSTVVQIKNFEPVTLSPNYDTFLELLFEFLRQSMHQEIKLDFIELLCSNGFLLFLVKLIPMSKKIRQLCLSTLSQILIELSIKNCNLSDWPGGEPNFRSYIFEGLFESDINFQKWPLKLNDVNASDAFITALIVFIYFSCLNLTKYIPQIFSQTAK